MRRGLLLTAMKFASAVLLSAMAFAPPAHAIVGGAAPAPETIARSVVTIVGSRGNFCTGSVIAPALVLTVAHCVQPGADYKIVQYGADKTPQLQDVKSVAIHPGFRMEAMLAHRATADVALLRLAGPATGKTPAPLGAPQLPIAVGAKFTIAGVGVTVRGDGKSAGTIRSAALIATGKPGTLADSPGRSGDDGRARGPLRLHRRFRLAGVRGPARCRHNCWRGELVDGCERQRRLRRYHRSDAANALSRLDFADGAAMGFLALIEIKRCLISSSARTCA